MDDQGGKMRALELTYSVQNKPREHLAKDAKELLGRHIETQEKLRVLDFKRMRTMKPQSQPRKQSLIPRATSIGNTPFKQRPWLSPGA
jgi:hypothetical protein